MSRSLPNCGQLLRDWPVGLGDNESAGLRGVEDATVADNGIVAISPGNVSGEVLKGLLNVARCPAVATNQHEPI